MTERMPPRLVSRASVTSKYTRRRTKSRILRSYRNAEKTANSGVISQFAADRFNSFWDYPYGIVFPIVWDCKDHRTEVNLGATYRRWDQAFQGAMNRKIPLEFVISFLFAAFKSPWTCH
jgi:hypothetical protein